MDISKIDKNFLKENIVYGDIDWNVAIDETKFNLCGVKYYKELNSLRRMEKDIAFKISENVGYLSSNTAGGRIRFTTNANRIVVKVVVPTFFPMFNMTILGQSGIAIYVNGIYTQYGFPDIGQVLKANSEKLENITFDCEIDLDGKNNNIEIYLGEYNGTREVYIGSEKGSSIVPWQYENNKKVVFYGSSITQGASSSHPGNDYISMLSRKFSFDFLNLGFSGSAKGEKLMAEYIKDLNMDIFVMDYDHNANDSDYLEKTHYNFYKIIRDAKPDIPIIFMTKPDFDSDKINNKLRRDVIYSTYKKAIESGDKLVDFIDGECFFNGDMRDSCATDTCHPNDLGFFRMATVIAPHLEKYL